MGKILDGLYLMDNLRGCNVYLFDTGHGPVLVDSGAAGNTERIVTQLHHLGHEPSDIRALFLTHTHLDHIGSAGELATRYGMPVYAHQTEIPYIEQQVSLPTASLAQQILNVIGERVMRRHPVGKVSRGLQDGEILTTLGDLEVVHTPGHTPGSMCLFQRDRKILFCGDLFFNAHPVTGKKGLRPSIPLVTVSERQVADSIQKIAQLEVDILCPGHGDPILRDA
ncbi:MAG: MBL fold metallo-hydrolase [Calditrichota bacterium]